MSSYVSTGGFEQGGPPNMINLVDPKKSSVNNNFYYFFSLLTVVILLNAVLMVCLFI